MLVTHRVLTPTNRVRRRRRWNPVTPLTAASKPRDKNLPTRTPESLPPRAAGRRDAKTKSVRCTGPTWARMRRNSIRRGAFRRDLALQRTRRSALERGPRPPQRTRDSAPRPASLVLARRDRGCAGARCSRLLRAAQIPPRCSLLLVGAGPLGACRSTDTALFRRGPRLAVDGGSRGPAITDARSGIPEPSSITATKIPPRLTPLSLAFRCESQAQAPIGSPIHLRKSGRSRHQNRSAAKSGSRTFRCDAVGAGCRGSRDLRTSRA
jgi:hypothetical protein